MNPQRHATTEELYRRYLESEGDSEARLDCLLTRMQAGVRQRLAKRGVAGEELEDLGAETMARLVSATQDCRKTPPKIIENYAAYALTTADRVFHDYMRLKRPNWRRLKRQILYLLDGKAGDKSAAKPAVKANGLLFTRWSQRSDWLAGFLRWRGRPFASTPRYQAFQENQDAFCRQALANREPERVPLPELLALLFRYLETPMEIDELTGHVAALRRLREPETLSLEGAMTGGAELALSRCAEIEAMENRVVNALASRTFQSNLWEIIGELPLSQRTALLLSMAPEMLLLLALASSIANATDIPFGEFAELWNRLPLPDKAIADRLNLTVKQTQNLRLIARKRILRHLAKREEIVGMSV